MNLKTLLRSFAGGEITPELFGRLDLVKFQTGLEKCLNFIVLPHGPVVNRPGFGYILESKDSAKASRMIPFEYSTQQTFAIEFGDQYVRFHTNGGTLLEATQNITGITKANPGVLTYAGADPTNGQIFFLSGIGGMTQLNNRYVKVANVNAGANTFELVSIHGGANINTTNYSTYTAGGTMARVYELATPYLEADLFDLHYVQSADVLTIVHPSYAPRELRRLSATNWTLTTISFVPTQAAPTSLTATTTAGAGAIVYEYVATAIASDGLEESLASNSDDCSNDLSGAGAKNTIAWTAASGAVRYNVYRKVNGLFGYIGQTSDVSFIDDNIDPDLTKTPPIDNNPFGSANNYPRAVGYFDGRRAFGGTNNKPQTFNMSKSGTESNFGYSIPTQDDDSIAVKVASQKANTIRHIVPLSDLMLLTSGGVVKVSAANSDILTPDSAKPKEESNIGASNVQPAKAGKNCIYAQSEGGRVQEIVYSWEQTGYEANDISLMAPHLFDGFTIKDIAYTHSPYFTVWCVRSDGVLLGLTYVPKHQVIAWHQHDTDGLFESICSVPESGENILYAIVKRTINSRTVRYVERLHTRMFDDDHQEDAFFLDAGVTYDGAAATTITGAYHLEGETVNVLADGKVINDLVVTNGAITLDTEASVVQLGLPIVADLKTLPIALEAQAGAQGNVKNINRAYLRVSKSRGIEAGPTFDSLVAAKIRTDEDYGEPPRLKTGRLEIVLNPKWDDSGPVCIRQSQPVPLTILSMTLEVALGG